jgi:hypothetical protein
MASVSSISFLATGIAVITAGLAMTLVVFKNQMESISPAIMSIIIFIAIPLTGYALTVLGSSIFQYTACNKVNLQSNAMSSLAVLISVGFATFILGLENLPIKKYIFGTYSPTDPKTGTSYPPNSVEYMKLMEHENHYKIQWFSNIVKATLPTTVSENVKDGFAYGYWIFFLTLLPTYFLMSLQSAC